MPRSIVAFSSCLCLCAGAAVAVSQLAQPTVRASTAAQPAQPSEAPVVNTMCPIGNEPIDGKTFLVVDGVRVGFCCPGCDTEFDGWTAQRKAAFIAEARAAAQPEHGEHSHDHGEHVAGEMPLNFTYYLPNCPVMQDRVIDPARGVVKEVDGREVRFCCERCEGRFDASSEAMLAKIDEMLIADQLPLYPMTTCLVMEGHEMGEDAVNMIYRNRLVRFCCEGCIEEFNADPEKYIKILDQAAYEAQVESYPMTDCAVAQHAIADGEQPTDVIVGGRLIRLCCPGCLQELERNPAEYVKMVDDARAAAGR